MTKIFNVELKTFTLLNFPDSCINRGKFRLEISENKEGKILDFRSKLVNYI